MPTKDHLKWNCRYKSISSMVFGVYFVAVESNAGKICLKFRELVSEEKNCLNLRISDMLRII